MSKLEMILGIVVGIDTALSMIPGVASNSTIQLMFHLIAQAKDALFPRAAAK